MSFCQAAIEIGIRGENAVFSPHADSGAQAIAEGARTLAEGKARVVLAGGVSEKITPQSLARAHLQGVLNVDEHSQDLGCRPFAAERNGTVLGEACGVLCLEPRASADRRGVSYGVAITGYGAAFGAQSAAAACADAIACAMAKALKDAELCASDIDVVIAHGEGTRAGDGNEIEAIQRVFDSGSERLPVFASKGALGHALAGAPAVDAILAESILKEQMLPPTLNSEPADPRVGFRLSSRAQQVAAKKILLNCRSPEGQCASLVFEAVS